MNGLFAFVFLGMQLMMHVFTALAILVVALLSKWISALCAGIIPAWLAFSLVTAAVGGGVVYAHNEMRQLDQEQKAAQEFQRAKEDAVATAQDIMKNITEEDIDRFKDGVKHFLESSTIGKD